MSVTHTHQTAIADDGSDVGATVWNADHTIAAPLTVPGTANTSSLVGTGYSLTGSNVQPMESWSGTLNTSGNVDVIKVAITDTAHGASSNFLALYGGAGGATFKAGIDLSGNVSGANLISSANFVQFSGNGSIFVPVAGAFQFGNGGATSVVLDANTADTLTIRNTARTANGALVASTVRTVATTVASLPAAATAGAGAHSFVTDATQTMTAGIGAAVVGGGANKVPVYCDGTGWFIG